MIFEKYYKVKKTCTLICITLFLVQVCSGQVSETAIDEVIKKEMAFFSMAPASGEVKTEGTVVPKLEAIPLVKCTDSFVSFAKGNLYATQHAISIFSEKKGTGSVIKSVNFFHYKFMLQLPDSAFTDLHDPNLCLVYSTRKKPGTSNCKVFVSEDKRRIYIYMLNGKGTNRYEVTWIINRNESKYYGRVVSPVPEQ